MAESASNQQMSVRQWVAVMGTMLGAFMAILDIQITNASLADISGGIAATPDEGSWISTSYLIGEIITIPLTAWLVRIFSLRYYLLANTAAFLFCSAMCGFSTDLFQMICFRVGQGFTGGVFIPTALTVVSTMMPKNLQPIGTTIFGLTATLAPAIGPYIGGLLTDQLGWQWNFFINFVPGTLMLVTVYATIDPKKMNLRGLADGDWVGIGMLAIGLGSLVAMLEEGQRKDWFGNAFIRDCGILAAVFIPAFVVWELMFAKEPVVKLHLLATRNLGVSTIVAFMLGLGLYGCVYLIPEFLANVQGYSPFLVGQTLVWVGLPQLLVFPFLPLLMKRFDMRLIICLGSLVFAYSCYMDVYMTPDFGEDQFIFSNIVRALGQPFTIVPITRLALVGLKPQDAGEGSAIFNMFRNLGGSFGIAILSTITQRREQFHDFQIGEGVSSSTPGVQQRLASTAGHLISRGINPARASEQAYDILAGSIRKSASVMAYNDAFLTVAICLTIGAAAVWFCKKPDFGAAPKPAG